MKNTRLVANTVIVLSAFILSSCMGAMMLGTGGHGSQSEGHSATEATLEKEVTVGELKATAVFPALELQKETVFVLKLSNTKTGEPIRRAKVYSHEEFEHSPDAHQGMNHMGMIDSSSAMKKEEKHGIDFQQEVDESSMPGMYSFSLKPNQSGIHTITFHITEIEGQVLSPALLIEANRMVSKDDEHHHSMGMFGMGSSTTYVLLGTAVMGTMMLTMWLVRGSIF